MKKSAKGQGMIMELMTRFPDEATCVAYLRQLRWPDGFVYLRCGAIIRAWC